MAKVLLIGDLPAKSTEGEVRELFRSSNTVVSLIPPDVKPQEDSVRSYVVELLSDEEAQNALALDGNGISVSLIYNGTIDTFLHAANLSMKKGTA